MAGHTLADLSLEQFNALPADARRVALLPMGSLEQHGPHLPLGTDSIIATSLAALVAEKTGAMVLPELPFTWAGGTRPYPVAINIRNQVVIDMLLAVFDGVRRAGFERLALVNWHGGSGSSLRIAVREYFMRTRWPVMILKPQHDAYHGETLVPLLAGNESEASCCLGGLEILGHAELVEPFIAYAAEATAEYEGVEVTDDFAELRQIQQVGMVGHDYSHECRHVQPSTALDAAAGRRYLDGCAERLAEAVRLFAEYDPSSR